MAPRVPRSPPGTTLADWKAGTLPFPPFPVRSARWNLAYSVVGEVGLDVLVESTDPEISPLAPPSHAREEHGPAGRRGSSTGGCR